jgi:hypothetical protein
VRERVVVAVGLALLVAGTAAHAAWGYVHPDLAGHARGSDDAFISFRYARHLAAGEGLVFNTGERVEGYSNLGYVLLLAPLAAASRGVGLLQAAIALNVACAAAAFVVLHRRIGPFALLLPAAPITWAWVASGMETPLVLLLQVLAWREVVALEAGEAPPRWRLPAWIVLLVLARADGFVGAGLVVVWLAFRRRRAALPAAAALAATLALVVAWRLAYYGAALPNTYHAKVSGPPPERVAAALVQLADLTVLAGLLPHLVALAAGAVLALVRRRGGFEPFFAACWLAFWLWVGGDVYGERFLLLLVPLAAAVVAGLPRPAAAAALVALLQLLPLAADRRFRYDPSSPHYDRWLALGDVLARPEHRGAVLATDAAGKMPYVSGLPTIDMLGLTDAHIARRPAAGFRVGHNKSDVDYVLGRRPDLVATWTTPELDLRWGLERARWEAAGYRPRYLAFARRRPPPGEPTVVDLRREGPAAAEGRIRRGWSYAVLERARF